MLPPLSVSCTSPVLVCMKNVLPAIAGIVAVGLFTLKVIGLTPPA